MFGNPGSGCPFRAYPLALANVSADAQACPLALGPPIPAPRRGLEARETPVALGLPRCYGLTTASCERPRGAMLSWLSARRLRMPNSRSCEGAIVHGERGSRRGWCVGSCVVRRRDEPVCGFRRLVPCWAGHVGGKRKAARVMSGWDSRVESRFGDRWTCGLDCEEGPRQNRLCSGLVLRRRCRHFRPAFSSNREMPRNA